MGNREKTRIIFYLETFITFAVLVGTVLAFVSPKAMETYVKYGSPQYESFLEENTRDKATDMVAQLRVISVFSLAVEIILTILLYQGYTRQNRLLLLVWIGFHTVSLLLGLIHFLNLLFSMAVLEFFITIAFYVYRFWTIHVILNYRKDILQATKEIYEMEPNLGYNNGPDYNQVY